MSKRSEKAVPLLLGADDSLKCERCGTLLCMGTDSNGVGIEWCPSGCFERVVPRRRSSCPECGEGIWSAEQGCIECGFGWTVRACPWDGTSAFWRQPGSVRGHEVLESGEAAPDEAA